MTAGMLGDVLPGCVVGIGVSLLRQNRIALCVQRVVEAVDTGGEQQIFHTAERRSEVIENPEQLSNPVRTGLFERGRPEIAAGQKELRLLPGVRRKRRNMRCSA